MEVLERSLGILFDPIVLGGGGQVGAESAVRLHVQVLVSDLPPSD